MKLLSLGLALAAAATAAAAVQAAPHEARRGALVRRQRDTPSSGPGGVRDDDDDARDDDSGGQPASKGPGANKPPGKGPNKGKNDEDSSALIEIGPTTTTTTSSSPLPTKPTGPSPPPIGGNKNNTTDTAPPTPTGGKPAKPTGAPCPTNGAKQCAATGGGYQVCESGAWASYSCDGSNVCGKTAKGEVACMSKDQATQSLVPCSTKDEQQCVAADPAKYQVCDGVGWQSFTCDGANVCKMKGGKAQCANPNGSGAVDVSYTLFEPSAFVPHSGALPLRARWPALAIVAAAVAAYV
ncbi:hypothetical protein H4R18_001753 [Coemansia javaensis]|uniref:Uncharacterized protein n=1 Tax=Coemansia javaensis TaxID=2761396 RepID=A0A9W8LKV7_9FUNG|nr:hypothetical protein H4R18_001753 [Coemansia javaensis]